MEELMRRLDVDTGKLVRLRGGDAYAEASARCLFCGTGDKCLRWLDQPQADTPPDFCPNLTLFRACKRRNPAS
jgi:hypothetical protein